MPLAVVDTSKPKAGTKQCHSCLVEFIDPAGPSLLSSRLRVKLVLPVMRFSYN